MDQLVEPIRQGSQWLFPDGRTLPVVSGGSDIGDIEIPDFGGEPPIPEFSEFAQGILNQIPEQDRPIVGKYMKTWDGNVTKKFQELNDQLRPYKELGDDYDFIKQAVEYGTVLRDNPVEFAKYLIEALKESNMWENETPQTPPPSNSVLPEYEGIPPQFLEEFNGLKGTLSTFQEQFTQFMQEQQQAQVRSQVDNLLSGLHNTHGDFDDDFVLMKMSAGMSPDDAIKAFKETISKYASPRKSPPTLPTGSGMFPAGQGDPSKMSKQDKMAAAVAALQNLQGN